MPINQAEAQAVTLAFVRDYPGALELAYRFRDNTGELYGHRAAEVPADLKGGYVPKETIHNGRAYVTSVAAVRAQDETAATAGPTVAAWTCPWRTWTTPPTWC